MVARVSNQYPRGWAHCTACHVQGYHWQITINCTCSTGSAHWRGISYPHHRTAPHIPTGPPDLRQCSRGPSTLVCTCVCVCVCVLVVTARSCDAYAQSARAAREERCVVLVFKRSGRRVSGPWGVTATSACTQSVPPSRPRPLHALRRTPARVAASPTEHYHRGLTFRHCALSL